jgi:hypothetical protein
MKTFGKMLVVIVIGALILPMSISAEETKEKKVSESLQGTWGLSGFATLKGEGITGGSKDPDLTIKGSKAEWADLFDLKKGKGTVTVDTTTTPPRNGMSS